MYLLSKISRDMRSKSIPELDLGIELQGNKIHPCHGQIYWFVWGEYTFDIRDLREKLNLKKSKPVDLNFDMNRCTRFQKMFSEELSAIGNTPLLEVFTREEVANV